MSAERNTGGKGEFLLAGRDLGLLPISLSIAAAWMWAPALMVAASLGYLFGAWGVFWFAVPNIIAVLLFGPVADKARKRLPDGATYSGFQRRAHSRRVMWLYLLQDSGALFTMMLANVVAGGVAISFFTDWPLWVGALITSVVPLSYTLWKGFRMSVLTDILSMTVILAVIIIGSLLTIGNASVQTLLDGFGGAEGATAAVIASGLGLTLTIHLLAAPYSDQTLWQRAWAAPEHQVRKAFYLGGALFAPAPILAGLMGMVVAGSGAALANSETALLSAVELYLPSIFASLFVIVVALAIIDTLDSAMSAVSAAVSDDNTLGLSVQWGRIAMAGATGVVFMVALGNPSIFAVQLLYGALAGSTLLPGLMTLFSKHRPAEPAMFWGVLAGFALGLPIFLFGLNGGSIDGVLTNQQLTAIGLIVTIGLSGLIVWAGSRYVYGHHLAEEATEL